MSVIVMIFVHFYFTDLLHLLTDLEFLIEMASDVKMMILLNISGGFPLLMMRGVIKAMGLQYKIIKWHLLLIAVGSPFNIYFMRFGSIGVWMMRTINVHLLLIPYFFIIYQADWQQIALVAYKKENG